MKAYFNNFFWLFLTYLLAPCFYWLIFLRKKRQIAKILIIQTGKIGDLVCTTPIFREIKEKFPSAHLTALVISQARGVLENNPRLDEILSLEDYPGIGGRIKLIRKLKKEKYQWAFNLLPGSFTNILAFWSLIPNRVVTTYRYSGEIIKLLSLFNNYRLEYQRRSYLPGHYFNLLKFIGIEGRSDKKEVFIKLDEEEKAQDFLKKHHLSRDDLLIGMAVTTGVKLKTWEPQKYARLADLLIEKLGGKIIFVGSEKDQPDIANVQKIMHNYSVSSAGFFKVRELAALLQNLKLFISGDTGPLFIADVMGLLLVDIAGPQPVMEQSPRHARCKIVQKELDCCPCNFGIATVRHCKVGHWRCIKDVMPEDVFEAAKELIEQYLQ